MIKVSERGTVLAEHLMISREGWGNAELESIIAEIFEREKFVRVPRGILGAVFLSSLSRDGGMDRRDGDLRESRQGKVKFEFSKSPAIGAGFLRT